MFDCDRSMAIFFISIDPSIKIKFKLCLKPMLDQENLHHLVLIPDFFVDYQPSKVARKHLK